MTLAAPPVGMPGRTAAPEPVVDDLAAILLVEDDDVDAQFVVRLLARLDIAGEVLRAETVAEATSLMAERRPRVVLLDLNLPDARGPEVVEAVAAVDGSAAIVVLSGMGEEQSATQSLQVGAEDYLEKGGLTGPGLERSIRYALTRKAVHERLRQTTLRLERSNREYDEFAHALAHDLRAPVRTARLLADRLVALTAAGKEPGDLGSRLDETLAHLDNVVLSMLDYAGLRTEIPDCRTVDVAQLTAWVIEALEADLEDSGAALEVDIEDGLAVSADADRLGRVFQNLVENAIKYRDPSEPLRLRITGRTMGPRLRITVADNGIGIPTEQHDKVFRMLEQLDRQSPGIGLGLSMCKRIVDDMDGAIWIDPSVVTGTTVVIELPRPDA